MGFFTDLVGSKPKVPKLTPIDVGQEQQKAIANNLAALPAAQKLVTAQNVFSRGEIKNMLSAAGINYDALSGDIGSNIESLLHGEIPTDVSNAVQRSGAARAIGGGYAGSEFHRDLTARDLGLVSLDLTGKGLSSAESWLRTAQGLFGPGEMDVKSMFVTPAFQTGVDTEERNTAFQRQWMKNQIDAMPAPWAEDLKQFVYRALSAYSGTAVQANPYSTPGSFGGGIGNGGGGGGGGLGGAGGATTYGGGSYGATQNYGEMGDSGYMNNYAEALKSYSDRGGAVDYGGELSM